MSKEDNFWNWFNTNNSRYYYLNQIDEEKKEKLLNEFLEQLHGYCDKLFFEIGGYPNEPQELIISAEGNKNYFHKVEALVSSAPKINDWEIIAFKPPSGVNFITEYEGIKLNPKEIWFMPLENENDIEAFGLRLHLPNYNLRKEKALLEGCYQVLDAILGEKSVVLDIAHVEIDKLPKKPSEKGLIELTELPQYIKWRNAKV